MKKKALEKSLQQVKKVASMIPGFDEISHGGLPEKRTTLISGTSGSGKTVFTCQFLYGGIIELGDNGAFVTFEEKPADIIRNMEGFGWDIEKLINEDKWAFVDASPTEIEEVESGRYNLEGLLRRVEYAIEKVKAKRIVIDSISAIFSRYPDISMVRTDLYRLSWKLKQAGITALITAERPTEDGQIARLGVEEFVSDNVILLHNRLTQRGQRERTIEILKFRGTEHDSEEAPLIVVGSGMVVYPRPKPKLAGKGFEEKISIGNKGLDEMFYSGIYKNSTTLVSGSSGTGKTVTAMHFIMEGAKNNEESLLIEFEESPSQLFRNANSFNWDLEKYVKKNIVQLVCHYPEDLKAEQYLKIIQDLVIRTRAKRVALDSLSALERLYSPDKFREFVIGLNAFLKMKNCTSLLTNTTNQLLGVSQITETHLSTITDNIILLKYVELGGRMHRLLSVLKERGSNHQKDLIEYEVTKNGIEILGPFEGVENLMGGSARRIKIDFDEKSAEREFIEESRQARI